MFRTLLFSRPHSHGWLRSVEEVPPSRRERTTQRLIAWSSVALVVLSACSQSPNPRATRSLRGVGDLSVFCAAFNEQGNLEGRPLTSCPDNDFEDGETRRLYALATQEETGEAALIDFGDCADATDCGARVLDLEVTQPGTNFLPVGAEPVSVASTPGGGASFVAVAETGREGIYALPTSCVGPRPEGALFRDIRTWPACRLPATPGPMQVLVDRNRTESCDGEVAMPPSPESTDCPRDLSDEIREQGRPKLVVALPSMGQLVTIDAQALLSRPQGSFDECPIERTIELQVEAPDGPLTQRLPDDWQGLPAQCLPDGFQHPTEVQAFSPVPSDLAVRNNRMYVSDFEAPVIHVLDIEDPCQVEALPPLLPASFLDPESIVTTRKVAVSPVTSRGEQFVYAIDNTSGRSAGSIMVFDVGEESGQRTPLIRPRSREISQEPPDRIQFDQEASDIEFAAQDFPEADPETGVAIEGVQCEPDPARSESRGALYRPDDADNEGASPAKLRGVFAFVTLHSGFVATIDIEDLDAPCRRPATTNPNDTEDRFGCRNDDFGVDELEFRGTPTVTDERSCHIVQPHRARGAGFYFAEAGGSAPALRSFPQLRDENGTSLAVDQSEPGRAHPRLLPVNWNTTDDPSEEPEATVFVGGTEYVNDRQATNRLILDPAESERNALVLPFEEPRAYTGNLGVTVTYEGVVRPLNDALFAVASKEQLAFDRDSVDSLRYDEYGVIEGGPNASFCASGVEDRVLIQDRGNRLMSDPTSEQLQEFGDRYGDYVEVIADLLPEDDPYWRTTEGRSCGEQVRESGDGLDGRGLCELVFGTSELPSQTRELRIIRAFDDRLILEPRRFDGPTARRNILQLVDCCFPQSIDYRIRASQQWVIRSVTGLDHDVETDPETLVCQRSCSPLVTGNDSRVFELSCGDSNNPCPVDGRTSRVVGPAEFPNDDRGFGRSMVCVLDEHPTGGVQPGDPGFECVHTSLTARFAIYRGLSPSERGMQFAWRVLGGFVPLSVDLLRVANLQTTSIPEKLLYVPNINRLLVADGGSTGLVLIGLRRTDGGPGFSGRVAF